MDQRTRSRMIRQAMQRAQEDATAPLPPRARERRQMRWTAPSETANSRIATLKSQAAQREILSIYDDRVQTEQQLMAVYSAWSTRLLTQHRITRGLVFKSFALIDFIILCCVLLDALVLHFIGRPNLDRRRRQELCASSSNSSYKVLASGLILLAASSGSPRQMPAMIGLATAGLTLVLQDFIISFFGWFVLHGKQRNPRRRLGRDQRYWWRSRRHWPLPERP